MKIYLANPRGFCAGVDRAIDIVDLSLKKYGAPIYVRHEIVHSRHVVNSLRQKGAVFVEELSEVPEGSVVIFSAHGVAKSVWEEANRRLRRQHGMVASFSRALVEGLTAQQSDAEFNARLDTYIQSIFEASNT